jgi:TonB family protein
MNVGFSPCGMVSGVYVNFNVTNMEGMVRVFLVCIVALASLSTGIGYGQASAAVELPKDPQTLLKDAAPYYDYDSANMKPWHLKASYQFYDSKGNPAEQGKWEYWWASPKVQRSTWTRNNVTQSEWSTADGIFRKQDGGSLRYYERNISNILLVSLPSEKAIDSGKMKLKMEMTHVGQMQLVRVSATLQSENNGKPIAHSPATSEVYCFSLSPLVLRLIYNNSFIYEYDQLVKTQNRYLAKQVDVMNGDRKVFSIAIDTIEGITPADPSLVRPTDATFISEPIREDDVKMHESGVTIGTSVYKAPPDYPSVAKMARIQGTVVIAAVIGIDGKIHDLETLVSPSQLLSKSAEDAVKKWEYKPYLLNGKPVEVETIVNVVFTLAG